MIAVMATLHAVLTSAEPLGSLRQLWSSLGTDTFLEVVVQGYKESAQKQVLQTLSLNIDLKQRRALLYWHSHTSNSALTAQLRRLKGTATQLLKEKQTQQDKAPKIEIKQTKTDETKAKCSHSRSVSRECTADVPPSYPIQKLLQPIKELQHNKCRRQSIEIAVNSPTNEGFFTKLKTDLQKRAKLVTSQDVGTRLFKQAQEILKRKELLKESYTPKYSFTPRITPKSERLLLTTMACRDGVNEEVAVVSSSLGLMSTMLHN
jgi:hypothetical protein